MEFKETKKAKLKKFFKETLRVLRITRKPNKQEYLTTVKVTGLGAAIIGAIGFVIFLIKQLLF
jgi:protein transport protein SEC61 subunit gamma and related proteins